MFLEVKMIASSRFHLLVNSMSLIQKNLRQCHGGQLITGQKTATMGFRHSQTKFCTLSSLLNNRRRRGAAGGA
jgi:hypothetical protein